MMASAAIPIYSQQEMFYVPTVQLVVRGRPLGAEIIHDIIQVTYKDSVNEIDTFNIEINNWDADKRTFKFAPPLKDSTQDFTGIFDPGAEIELWMGYQNQSNMRRMMLGEITSLEPSFTESGAPTLSINGLNEIHQLRGEQHTYSWTDKSDTDIAIELGNKPVKSGQPGLGIPVVSNPSTTETADSFVFMNSQYDIVFLLERARRNGYEVYLDEDEKTGKKTLYFGLSQSKGNAPVYRLEWGRSLINFKPTLSTAKQVSQITVRGWDRTAKAKIEVNYTLQNLWKDQGKSQAEITRLSQIAKAYANRTDVVTKPPVRTTAEAKQLARATLEDQSKRLIVANGSTVGLPDLRAGCALEIIGFGIRTDSTGQLTGTSSDFDGEYYVTASTHTIGGGGYRTDFTARREGPVQLQKTVSTGGR
jgi:phage protein D